MDIGQRIRQARMAQGVTMRELGHKVGVSAAAISKYESGKDVPRPSVMIRLAKELRVRSEFLVRQDTVNIVQQAFRQDRPLSKKMRESVVARIRNEMEKLQMVESLSTQGPSEFTVNLDSVATIEDVELAADALRSTWQIGYGPIANLTACLEDHGVKVFTLGGIPEFDGFSCRLDSGAPVIAYSADIPGDRQRFTMAHEFAHLILTVADGLDEEKAANRFAGALLVPGAALVDELGAARVRLTVEELSILKQKYGLSMQSICRRAYELGIVKRSVWVSMRKLFKKEKWTKVEPGEQFPKERPLRYSLLLLRAAAEELMTPSTIAALASRSFGKQRRISGEELQQAVESMVAEYRNDRELIAFTLLNTEGSNSGDRQSGPR